MSRTTAEEINYLKETLAGKSLKQTLFWLGANLSDKLTLASSLGAEDQLLTDIIGCFKLNIPIFTLDTGRLFDETYNLLAETEKKYELKIKVYFPDYHSVQKLVKEQGINGFYTNTANRKMCCRIRKMEPLKHALSGYQYWMCGLRQSQSEYREATELVEWDDTHKMIKINPLANWSDQEVWNYIKSNQIPYNPLHDKGFISIGCSCCTRAIKPGEPQRAGRWWWEDASQKECGLHFKDGKLVRAKTDSQPEELATV